MVNFHQSIIPSIHHSNHPLIQPSINPTIHSSSIPLLTVTFFHGSRYSIGMEAERALVEAAQKDPNRFAELYEMHFNRVYAYIVSRVRDRFEAQDLTADVFHQALAKIQQYEWRGVPFVAWLLKIASNVIVDRHRQASRAADLPSPSIMTETDFDQGANHSRLFECVNNLPTDQKRVIVLRFAEQKSIREIAEDLNRSEGAIKQLQFRALQNLRMQMGETNG